MSKNQSIGNSNQHQGLPAEMNQDTKTKEQPSKPTHQEDEKPVFTNDEGNTQPRESNSANGYNEKKPTDPYSQLRANDDNSSENVSPDAQPANTEKVYGEGTRPFSADRNKDELPEQDSQMEQQRKEAQSERD